MTFSTKVLNGTLQISVSGEEGPRNRKVKRFAYLHGMFWGQPRAETLDRIIEEWSVSVPQYDGFMGLGLSLDKPQEVKPMKEYKYRTIDIRKSNIFPQLPSEWQDIHVLPCELSQFVLLEDYPKLYNKLLSLDQESKDMPPQIRSHASIGAQPGIGKSIFLSYVLIIRLIEGKTTVFQAEESDDFLFLFDKKGVTLVPKDEILGDGFGFLDDKDVWILIDDMPLKALYTPDLPKCFLLQAASPVKAKFPARKRLRMYTFYMDVWDWNEVVAGLWVASEPDPETDYWPLWCVYARYGGLPRLIYLDLKYTSKGPPTNLEDELGVYDENTENLAFKLKDYSPGDYFTSDSLPHDIIVTRPRPTGRRKPNGPTPFSSRKREISRVSQSGIRTVYIMDIIFEVLAESFRSKALALYKYLSAVVDAKTFQGHLFEKLVHQLFGAGCPPTKTLRLLADGQHEPITFRGTKQGLVEFGSSEDLGKRLRKTPGQRLVDDELSGLYLKSTQRNFPAIDSMTLHKVGDSYEIYFFQMTVSKEHPIKIEPKGLKGLYDGFPHGLKGPGVTIYFVFVVPDTIAGAFHKQALMGGGKQYNLETSEPWIKGIQQMVLGLTDDELFEVKTEADHGDELSPKRQRMDSLLDAVESPSKGKRKKKKKKKDSKGKRRVVE